MTKISGKATKVYTHPHVLIHEMSEGDDKIDWTGMIATKSVSSRSHVPKTR